jgi:hypothetical protein
MTRSIFVLAILLFGLVLAAASPVAADVELLAPETAAEQVAQSEGVVLVDLFAHW